MKSALWASPFDWITDFGHAMSNGTPNQGLPTMDRNLIRSSAKRAEPHEVSIRRIDDDPIAALGRSPALETQPPGQIEGAGRQIRWDRWRGPRMSGS